MFIFMHTESSWFNRLKNRKGYYEIEIKDINDLIELINPRASNIRLLVTDLKFIQEHGENVAYVFDSADEFELTYDELLQIIGKGKLA